MATVFYRITPFAHHVLPRLQSHPTLRVFPPGLLLIVIAYAEDISLPCAWAAPVHSIEGTDHSLDRWSAQDAVIVALIGCFREGSYRLELRFLNV
jgi:hypothetical protein